MSTVNADQRSVLIRDAVPGDYRVICALNLADVQHTSAMDEPRLKALHGWSCYHKVVCVDGDIAGFLLAMGDTAPYENDNFEWFAHKHPRFIYVDRIVVSSGFRALRLGSRLYADLFGYARCNGIPLVTCEYNIVPPNEASRRFHDKFGFKEQGTQWVAQGAKRVSLQAAEVKIVSDGH